jgi:hypothetical protein
VLESRKNLPRKHERYKGGTAFICVCVWPAKETRREGDNIVEKSLVNLGKTKEKWRIEKNN